MTSRTKYSTEHTTTIFYDANGGKLDKKPSQLLTTAGTMDAYKEDSLLHSVYLAEGIHHHITDDIFEDLPDRVQGGSIKARLSWFGALCF